MFCARFFDAISVNSHAYVIQTMRCAAQKEQENE
jgi:hypothetical protein